MEVKKIIPQGYCKGVILALKKCLDAIDNPLVKRPIYLLGMPIHNKKVSEALENKGLIILDNESRLQMLDQIDGGTVIISAHGAAKQVFEKAKNKGLDIIDATCDSVNKIQNTLRKTDRHILYIGIKNHPESEAILTEFGHITLIESINDINKLDYETKYFATNQTTMSIFDTEDKYKKLKELNFNVESINLICDATTLRQKALVDKKADLFVIVGDKKSSNTQKLYELALTKTIHKLVLKIETLDDLAGMDLSNYQTAYVTSGASTPKKITEEIVNYLTLYPNKKAISELTLDDYLSI